jgi:RHH-type transcriptional regulator, rel operon repressor / antitoxin RelB
MLNGGDAVLGLRLDRDTEQRLVRFARETRRSKSDVARDAMREYLDRHAVDDEMQRQLKMIAAADRAEDLDLVDAAVDDLMRDEPDYDWGAPRT